NMDTGGLAQMTYNNFSPAGGLGMPGAGFASRGKGSGLKRLSVASPPSIAPISENGVETSHTPRTSRSHLLAGLRTQPKTPGIPASAPYNQTQHRFGLDASKYSGQNNNNAYGQNVPHTAIGATFSNTAQQYSMSAGQQVYALPEQVLAPPTIDYADMQSDDVDPSMMSQLMATELFLAQRQQQLQQQLFNLTSGLQGINMNGNANGMRQNTQSPQTPITPQMSYYSQQLQNGVSPIPQEVPGQPGLYVVYNPMTGQYTYALDPSVQQLANSPPPATPNSYSKSAFNPETPTFQVSPPIETSRTHNPFDTRSISPPKKSPSPPADNVAPLPPPSATAFRRGHHKKVSSLAFDNNSSSPTVSDGPKSAITRPVGFPATPMTGTFGPGNARAGEHPVRQPRGPPPMEELVAAPTSKHEGSKNFASRQRRRAVHSLVKAGIERRGVGRQNSMDSTGNSIPTPGSETEDSIHSAMSGSGSLSGRPSYGSLKAAANAAIGSEMKQRKASGDSATSMEEFVKELPGNRRSPMGMLAGAGLKRVY
ncbi:hypothetical protein NA57DRAFT_31981, partial [Rhizodiscina lignyota]